uniref:V-type proton ATPase subunit a n=1 Tax=Macrostomum lignano TaxID=282301 RepID=A0A1I8IP46_9PLAT
LLVPAEVAFECLVALGNLDAPVHIGSDGSRSTPIVVSSISGPSKHCRDLLMTLGSVRSHLTAYGEFIRLHCGSDWRPDESEIDSLAATLKPQDVASICSLHKDLTELAKLEADMNSERIRGTGRDPRSVPAMADKEAAGILLHGGSSTELDTSAESTDRTLPFIVGVVPTSKAHCLRLGVWRRFHLTALYTDIPVRDQRDLRDEPVEPHNVFLIVSLSESQSRTAERLCGMLGAQPGGPPKPLNGNKGEAKRDAPGVPGGEEHRKRLALNGWTKWRRWFAQLTAMQAVHRALDGFSRGYGKQFYVGEVWCSREAVDSVRQALAVGSSRASGLHATVRLVENSRRRPPTRMPRHELTAAVRDLTYQFGVPAHWEIDPTPFTAVTFPFLFAIMFADWGHGLLLMALALALFLPPGRFLHPDVARSLAPLRPGRHLLLMCAVFAVYCGAVLNDGFGLTGGWRRHSQFSMGNLTYGTFVNQSISQLQLAPKEDGHVMSWVTDSMWGSAANQVKFLNSARMKLSIIFGTLHLGLGLALQLVNDIRAGRTARLRQDGLPLPADGYPVALILRKWLAVLPRDAACAPALLPMLIAMYRLEYTETPCYLATYYSGQRYVEHAIVAGVAASALLAIFGLPIHHALTSRGSSSSKAKAEQKLTAAATDVPGDREEEEIGRGKSDSAMPLTPLSSSSNSGSRGKSLPKLEPEPLDCAHGEKQFDLLEHCLACFEFLLSSLSHSASYLRLWAIGLAHGELTAIMWPMLLMPPTRLADLLAASPTAALLLGGLTLAASFCLWACITVCILVGMEGMTALLHSLRLHWIEFQSKFYSGAGYMFRPFSLKAEVRQAMDSCADFAASGEEFH